MTIAVIGCGIMGRGIVYVALARAKQPVVCVELSQKVIDEGIKSIKRFASRDKLDADTLLAQLSWSSSIDDAFKNNSIDFVIEAVPEKLSIKSVVFRDLVKFAPSDVILATNTSSLPISSVAETVDEKERWRIIGMHFFNPVPRLAGLEVIVTKYTAEHVIERTKTIAEAMGKKVSLCKLDIAGFLVNRILNANLLEAISLFEKGAGSPEDIDSIMKNAAGYPIGPFKLADMIGLDTSSAVSHVIYEESGKDPRYKPSDLLDSMVKAGHLGMKTGKGFYSYNKL